MILNGRILSVGWEGNIRWRIGLDWHQVGVDISRISVALPLALLIGVLDTDEDSTKRMGAESVCLYEVMVTAGCGHRMIGASGG